MCIYDNSITLLLCGFYASIQSNTKAIDITEMLWYYIITEEQQTQTQRGKANPKLPWNFTENMNAKIKQTAV